MASRSSQTNYQAIVSECDRLAKANPPYVFGGGHTDPAPHNGPFDCSSAVSRVLQAAGYNCPTTDSSGFKTWGNAGTGEVTIWASDTHVFLMFSDKCWAWSCPSCHNGWQPLTNYGPQSHPTIDGPYVARHPADLRGPAGSSGGGTTSPSTTGIGLAQAEQVSKAAAFATYLDLPGLFDQAESVALSGARSLMNDQPLMPFVQQLCKAALRRFQSMPNGDFYAFYPDYFGGLNHRSPYWQIDDIEILNGQINLSDEPLATHVFTVGDIVGHFDGITIQDEIKSAGVVSIFDAFSADFINGLDTGSSKKAPAQFEALKQKDSVIAFLQRYGARPFREDAPWVRSPYYELFLAYQTFCLMWSQQFQAAFQLTFMPELFPGGLVTLPDHNLQLFIEGVEHVFDYETGFQTNVEFSAPTSTEADGDNANIGMIRSHALTPNG